MLIKAFTSDFQSKFFFAFKVLLSPKSNYNLNEKLNKVRACITSARPEMIPLTIGPSSHDTPEA